MEIFLVNGDIGRIKMDVGKEQNIKEKMKMKELYWTAVEKWHH